MGVSDEFHLAGATCSLSIDWLYGDFMGVSFKLLFPAFFRAPLKKKKETRKEKKDAALFESASNM